MQSKAKAAVATAVRERITLERSSRGMRLVEDDLDVRAGDQTLMFRRASEENKNKQQIAHSVVDLKNPDMVSGAQVSNIKQRPDTGGVDVDKDGLLPGPATKVSCLGTRLMRLRTEC